jgi:hypothetical protein
VWQFELVDDLEGVLGVSEGLERRAGHCLREDCTSLAVLPAEEVFLGSDSGERGLWVLLLVSIMI